MTNAFDAVRAFEVAIAEYAGAGHAVATSSCTDAILLACVYLQAKEVEIPRRTFIGVAQAILNAGARVRFRDEVWSGGYQLSPYPLYDMARRTRAGMHIPGTYTALSFHASKILGFSDGGALLCDDLTDATILRRMCYDGRPLSGPWTQTSVVRGMHCYMAPSVAAGLHRKLDHLPHDNADLPNSYYPDLSEFSIFSQGKTPA